MTANPSVDRRWADRLADFVPGFLAASPALSPLIGRCATVLHGSTCLGVDDAFSDLDVWAWASEALIRQAEAVANTRFFGFELDGKKGHFNLEVMDDVAGRAGRCDMERIAELRVCHVLTDVGGMAAELVAQASWPMREAVRRAWFCHHYVEMRGFHRNGDNPIERGDAVAALFGLVPTLEHALRAAMVLDGEPYPYIKWLAHAARQTPTGSRLAPLVDEVIAQLGDGALQVPGPEETHPLGVPLRAIRNVLIDAARATGIDGPWLERWWLHIPQSRAGVTTVRW